MHVIKNKTQKIVSICFFLISASLFTLVSYNLNSSLENYPSFKLDDTLKQADIPWSYNLTGDAGIYIDDSNPSYNWSTFLHFDWVTGNGTGGNPYEIKNILFDGEGRNMNIITIKNSIATFRIEECILYNTYGWDGDYNHGNAIYLENVVNGIISNVNTSGCTNGIRLVNCGPTNILRSFASNNRWGISLYNSHNNDIEYNRVFKNYLDGIEMDSSSSNTIAFNEIFENSNLNDYSGIKLYYSSHNNITNNKVNLNRFQAIIARYSSFNNILNNVISKNSQGIECYNSHFNTIYNNSIEDTAYYGMQIKSSNNNNITDNVINSTQYGDGIYLFNSDHSTIVGNIINNTYYNGIYLDFSDNSNISGNVINHNNYYHYINSNGIFLRYSNETHIIGNLIENSGRAGILVVGCYNNYIRNNLASKCNSFGMSLIDSEVYPVSSNSLIECGYNIEGSLALISNLEVNTSNLVNGKPLHFYYNISGLNQMNFSNTGQIILYSCDSAVLSNMNFNNCSLGIALYYCETPTITDITSSFNNQGGVYLRECNNIQISGDTLSHNGGPGIKFQECNSSNILDNTLNFNTEEGIRIDNSFNITIIGNEINDNNWGGISFLDCLNNTVTDNTVNGNGGGIYLSQTHNTTISNNIASYNKHHGIHLANCFDLVVSENTLNARYSSSQIGLEITGGRMIISDNVIYNNFKVLKLTDSNDIKFENNFFSTDDELQVNYINIAYCSFIEFKDNELKASGLSILIIELTYSSDNIFINNKLTWGGFQLENSDYNQFLGNYISDNGIAFSLEDSSYNTIINNTMINVMQCYRELGDCVANVFEDNYCEEAGLIPIFNIIGAIIGICGVGIVTTVMLFKRRRINREFKESEM